MYLFIVIYLLQSFYFYSFHKHINKLLENINFNDWFKFFEEFGLKYERCDKDSNNYHCPKKETEENSQKEETKEDIKKI